MTIPGLMTAYRKHVVSTRLASFYSKINNTMRLSEESENGEVSTWPVIPSTADPEAQKQWLRQYISPYLKCHEDTISAPGRLIITIYDGTSFSMSGSDWRVYPLGYKKREKPGENFFFFEFMPNGCTLYSEACTKLKGNYVMPYMYNFDKFSREEMSENCKGKTLHGVGGGAYCTVLIQQNGWKIPSDYPHKL